MGKQHLQPLLAPVDKAMPDSHAFWRCLESKDWTGPYYGLTTLDLLLGESNTAALAGHSLLSEFGERGITVAGSAFLILGHVRNQHLCSHDQCHDHDAITESHHHN